MNIEKTALEFFEACETGGGWATCRQYCRDEATFSCQAETLSKITSLLDYTEWMKALLTPIPDGRYELKAFATDHERSCVVGAAVFHGTHTSDGGPIPPTGNSVSSDYTYVIQFNDDKIEHVTKIWNDTQALMQLGWSG